MVRARANREVRLCEECGQPIQGGRANQFLCHRCEEAQEHARRKGERERQDRRSVRRDEDVEDR